MSHSEFYTLSQNLPFTVALAVVTILCLMEGVMLFIGVGVINLLDSLFPDFDMEIDGFGLEDQGLVSKTLSFLRAKNVPLVILLVLFLVSFGLTGLVAQAFCIKIFGFPVNGFFLSIPAFFIGLTMMKGIGEVISKIIPADETDAIEIKDFTNKVGIITLGVAKASQPAQCKIKDHTGKLHYFMVYPDNEANELKQGEKVLLVRYEDPYFYAIKPDNKNI
jgi:hypothetical protein